MELLSIPLTATWNMVSSTAATPDGGFLYIGFKSVNYISKIEDDKNPIIKAIFTRQKIKSIDCDPDWSETKYFAALADDSTIQIWDVSDGKAKKGHKAHIKTTIGDGDGPHSNSDNVAMCFLRNRTILSINSSCMISYCVQSNRYTKKKRIVSIKYKINILKGSPCDERIIAMGTTRGLILIVNLKNEELMYTFSGHTREITSLSWHVILPPIKTPKQKQSRRRLDSTVDEIFDIYDYDYLENEFGAPSQALDHHASDTESAENGLKDILENENFNFAEECKNLKDDILALKKDKDIASVSDRNKQVTLKDCEQSIKDKADSSMENDSDPSVEFLDSSDESNRMDESRNNYTLRSLNESQAAGEKDSSPNVFLASASIEGSVWVWNTRTGESIDRIILKGSHGQHANNYIDVCWLNDQTLVMNDKSCELVIFKASAAVDNKLKFIQEKCDTVHRGVVGVCKLKNSETVWTISSYRELICEDIGTKKILVKYSCAVTGVSAMRECPNNMNRVAFAFPDRRIAVMSLGNINPKKIPMENFSLKDDVQIISLSWCPNDKFLAFGTMEGRVGVVDTEKSSNAIILMKPFSGKPVYSLNWSGNLIFACSNEKVAYYEWKGKTENAVKLEAVTRASCIVIRDNCLLVGTQNGDVVLYERTDTAVVDFMQKSEVHVSSKYITEICFNPLNPSRAAVSSIIGDVTIIELTESNLVIDQVLASIGSGTGNSWVKWSNRNESLLVSCGYDGAVRIWDLSCPKSEQLVFLKQFDSPMLCALFSPINEDIVICAGKATSIEMFDYKNGVSSVFCKMLGKKNKDKPLGAVLWGTRLDHSVTGTGCKRKTKKLQNNDVDANVDGAALELVEKLEQVKLEEFVSGSDHENISSNIPKNQTTILHLSAKEFNKDALQNILRELSESSENREVKLMSRKLFGSRQDAQDFLNDELRNHQASNTKSIGRILIPQINGDLKKEILECIQTKRLTEVHVSLAPTISYEFWIKCCRAYANQLFELGLSLSATPYLLACHEIKECIEELMNTHCYREAWVIAKIYRDSKDPILQTVLTKWIDYLETTGNLEAATLLCTLSGKFELGFNILSKRRQLSDDHQKVLQLLDEEIKMIDVI